MYKLLVLGRNTFHHTTICALAPAHWQFWPIGIMIRVFANGSGDRGSIPGRLIPKTQNMVFDVSLLNTRYYKVRIKGKMEECQGKELHLFLHLGVVAIQKGAFGSPFTTVSQLICTLFVLDRIIWYHIMFKVSLRFCFSFWIWNYIYIYIYVCVCVKKQGIQWIVLFIVE